MTNKKRTWVDWFDELNQDDKRTITLGAIERLIEIEEVRYQEEDNECEEDIYWTSCGESLKIPF